jgi:hypothetical protein
MEDQEDDSEGIVPSLLQMCLFTVVENATRYTAKDLAGLPLDLKELMFGHVLSGMDSSVLESFNLNRLIPFIDDEMRHLSFSHRHVVISNKFVAALQKCCPKLESLVMKASPCLTYERLRALLGALPKLQALDISASLGVSPRPTDNPNLFESVPNLSILRATGLAYFDARSIRSLASCCPRLRELHLDICSHVNDQSIDVLAYQLPALQHLVISDCNSLTEGCIAALVEMQQLETLDVCRTAIARSPKFIRLLSVCFVA